MASYDPLLTLQRYFIETKPPVGVCHALRDYNQICNDLGDSLVRRDQDVVRIERELDGFHRACETQAQLIHDLEAAISDALDALQHQNEGKEIAIEILSDAMPLQGKDELS